MQTHKPVTLNGLDNSILVPDVSTYRGNSALFQCKIPPHLEDVIRPAGWLVADSGQQSAKLMDSLFIPIGTTKGEIFFGSSFFVDLELDLDLDLRTANQSEKIKVPANGTDSV